MDYLNKTAYNASSQTHHLRLIRATFSELIRENKQKFASIVEVTVGVRIRI